MKITRAKRKRNHIQKIPNVITGGLATFLIMGLSGCDGGDPTCKDLKYAPQWKIEECKRSNTTGSSGHSTIMPFMNTGTSHSGYFTGSSSKSSSGSRTSFSSGG